MHVATSFIFSFSVTLLRSKNSYACAIQPVGSTPSKIGSSTHFLQLRRTSPPSTSDSSSEFSGGRRSRPTLTESRLPSELRCWLLVRRSRVRLNDCSLQVTALNSSTNDSIDINLPSILLLQTCSVCSFDEDLAGRTNLLGFRFRKPNFLTILKLTTTQKQERTKE
ncbi:hypothetical protein LR48_Vigan03g009200 [Vigna angularis]|uniref:Secreted protein n=1 Tax=Phaseolus angularis TaxID=3914 RepID=A0A0L9U1R8_PHAAN|nr:hypothetical protein LR48_Vigan03g009200 [Vigna angularis]